MKWEQWVMVSLALSAGVAFAGCDSGKEDNGNASQVAMSEPPDKTDDVDEDDTKAVGEREDEGSDAAADKPAEAPDGPKVRAAAPSKDLLKLVSGAGFAKFKAALEKTALDEMLSGEGPFTVFVPNDTAFQVFEQEHPGFLAGLDDKALGDLLRYHMVAGKFRGDDFLFGQLAITLTGAPIAMMQGPTGPVLNMQRLVTTPDIEATNGMMHVLNEVIMPPGDLLAETKDVEALQQLTAAIAKAGLEERLTAKGQFTLFAPSDGAFAKLKAMPEGDALKELLLYHLWDEAHGPIDLVHQGVAMTLLGAPLAFSAVDGTTVNDANFYAVNTVASNGVLHVMEEVLSPPSEDLITAAKSAGFTKMAELLTKAEIVEGLSGTGPFTLFAPTNESLNAMKTMPEGDALKALLLYHILDGSAVGAGNLKAGALETKAGKSIAITGGDGRSIALNGNVAVTEPNILARNGVIQGIDGVLIPPQ